MNILLKTEELQILPSGYYGSSVDALQDLQKSCKITGIDASLSHISNGLGYSFVEVTCSDGVQYGLQAYGNEALELHRMAFQELIKISLKSNDENSQSK